MQMSPDSNIGYELQIKWKGQSQKYGPDKHWLFVGKIWVGFVQWQSGNVYNYYTSLPALKADLSKGTKLTIEEAKEALLEQVKEWYKACGIEVVGFKDNSNA